MAATTTTGSKLETRLVLLIGMAFIVAFGVVLSEVAQNDGVRGKTIAMNIPAPAAKVVPPGPDCPIVDDPSPVLVRAEAPVRREPTVAPLPAVAPPPVTEGVAVHLLPPSNDSLRLVLPGAAETHAVAAVDPRSAEPRVAGPTTRPGGSDTPAIASAGAKYTVVAKDSFIRIAKKVYGDDKAMEYKRIQEANKAVLGNKNILTAGMVLVIPDLPGAPARTSSGTSVASGTPARAGAAGAVTSVAAVRGTTPGVAAPHGAAAPAGTVTVALGSAAATPGTPTTMPSSGGIASRVPVMTVDEMRHAFGADTAPATSPGTGSAVAAASGHSGIPGLTTGRTAPTDAATTGRTIGSAGTTPTGTPVSTASAGASPRGKTYVVKPGDSLAKIARLYLRDDSPAAVQKLYQANKDKMSSPNALVVGRSITIPS